MIQIDHRLIIIILLVIIIILLVSILIVVSLKNNSIVINNGTPAVHNNNSTGKTIVFGLVNYQLISENALGYDGEVVLNFVAQIISNSLIEVRSFISGKVGANNANTGLDDIMIDIPFEIRVYP